jgi:hypothetical protein
MTIIMKDLAEIFFGVLAVLIALQLIVRGIMALRHDMKKKK